MKIDIEYGVTHAGSGAGNSAPGSMQHIALNVDTPEDLLAMRDRIRSRGINVFGPLQHGLCQSIYFGGPEGLALEIATSGSAIAPLDNDGTWIDRDVQALAGISDDELAALMSPADYLAEAGRSSNLFMILTSRIINKEIYEAMLAADEVITGASKMGEPLANIATELAWVRREWFDRSKKCAFAGEVGWARKLSGPASMTGAARVADASGFDVLYLGSYGVSVMLAKPDNFLSASDMEAVSEPGRHVAAFDC